MKKGIRFISLLLLFTIIIQTFDLGSLSLFGQITTKAKIQLEAPKELKCINRTDQSIALSWKVPEKSYDILGYKIYFGNKCIKTVSKNKTNCVLNSLVPNKQYSLYIRAYGNDGETSKASNIIDVETLFKVSYYDFSKENNNEIIQEGFEYTNLDQVDLGSNNLEDSNFDMGNNDCNSIEENSYMKQEPIIVYSNQEITVDESEPDNMADNNIVKNNNKVESTEKIINENEQLAEDIINKLQGDKEQITDDIDKQVNNEEVIPEVKSEFENKSTEINTETDFKKISSFKLEYEKLTTSSVLLKWKLLEENTSYKYEVFVDNVKVNETKDNFIEVNNLISDKEYSFTIKVLDKEELCLEESNTINLKTQKSEVILNDNTIKEENQFTSRDSEVQDVDMNNAGVVIIPTDSCESFYNAGKDSKIKLHCAYDARTMNGEVIFGGINVSKTCSLNVKSDTYYPNNYQFNSILTAVSPSDNVDSTGFNMILYGNYIDNVVMLRIRTKYIDEWITRQTPNYPIESDLFVITLLDEASIIGTKGNRFVAQGLLNYEFGSKGFNEGSLYADPIDTNTGALIIDNEVLSISGNKELSFNLDYNSKREDNAKDTIKYSEFINRLSDLGKAPIGKGWSHNYESKLSINNDETITVYWNSYDYTYYYKSNDKENTYYSNINNFKGNTLEYYSSEQFYLLTLNNGNKYYYNKQGLLTKLMDSNGKYIKIIRYETYMTIFEESSSRKIFVAYDKNGRIIRTKDDTGRITSFEYDTNNNLIKINYPNGKSISYSYDLNGYLLNSIDGDGITFLYNTYDDRGRVISQKDGEGGTSTLSYADGFGEMQNTIIKDRNGNTKKVAHNIYGQLMYTEDQLGNKIEYTYDEYGNKITEKDALGSITNYKYDENGNLIEIITATNNKTTMECDVNGNILSLTDPEGNTTKYTYNDKNLLIQIVSPNGKITKYTYNSKGMLLTTIVEENIINKNVYKNGKVITSYDIYGNATKMTYNQYGWLSSVTDREGYTIYYEYDKVGNKISETTKSGGKITYSYNSRGLVTSKIDERGNKTTYKYNGNGKLIETIDSNGNIISNKYDGEENLVESNNTSTGFTVNNYYDKVGRIIKTTDSIGNETTYTYDGAGKIISATIKGKGKTTYEYYSDGSEKSITDALGNKTIYYYDGNKNIINEVNALGNSTTYTYDSNGKMLTKKTALGYETKYLYDKLGQLIKEIDPNDNITTYSYTLSGKVRNTTNALGNTTNYEYDKEDRMIKTIDSNNNSIAFEYDSNSKIIKITDPLGNTEKITYDISGNIITREDANDNIIEKNIYDNNGNKISEIDALGYNTEYYYNKLNELIKHIDKLNNTYLYEYNSTERLTKVTDPLIRESKKNYNSDGTISEIIDPNGNKTSYKYDSLGRKIKEITPLSYEKNYTYNAIGLIEKIINESQEETNYQYDLDGRLVKFKDNLGEVYYTYDNNGNILTVTDSNGTIARKYDKLNRVIEYTDFRGNTVKYSYDTCGNLIALTYPGGKIVRYSYDAIGKLISVTAYDGRITKYEYDKNSRLTKTIRPNGTVLEITYDLKGQITSSIETDKDGILFLKYTYKYDANGNIIVEKYNYSKDSVGKTYNYIYDSCGTLISVTKQDGTVTKYSYDINGNIISEKQYSATNEVINDNLNMTYNTGNVINTYNEEKILYDAKGNMLYGPLNGEYVNYEYDCRNRLIKVGNIEYIYDAENNRIAVIENGVRTDYVINPESTLSQILIKRDSKGNEVCYIYGNGLIGEKSSGGYLTYHFDSRGSTVAITDINGKIISRFSYDVYGKLIWKYGSKKTPFMYNGRDGVVTDNNDLVYMRARYYSIQLRRFINQDTVVGDIQDNRSLNRYAYVYGDPVNKIDPLGLSPEVSSFFSGHDVLDLLGWIPGYGELFDVANAGLYFAEGDYTFGVLSSISIIPFVGDIAGKGGKWGIKATRLSKYGDNVADGAKKSKWVTKGVGHPKSLSHPVLDNPRVGSALKGDKYHDINDIVDNYAIYSEKFDLPNVKGHMDDLYQIEGSIVKYKTTYEKVNNNAPKMIQNKEIVDGVFEWVVDPTNSTVTHRTFIPGGKVTGKIN